MVGGLFQKRFITETCPNKKNRTDERGLWINRRPAKKKTSFGRGRSGAPVRSGRGVRTVSGDQRGQKRSSTGNDAGQIDDIPSIQKGEDPGKGDFRRTSWLFPVWQSGCSNPWVRKNKLFLGGEKTSAVRTSLHGVWRRQPPVKGGT